MHFTPMILKWIQLIKKYLGSWHLTYPQNSLLAQLLCSLT